MGLISDQKLLSNRGALVGKSTQLDINGLNPASYSGAVMQGKDDVLHYSDGTRWMGLAPIFSTFFDGGNAATEYAGPLPVDFAGSQLWFGGSTTQLAFRGDIEANWLDSDPVLADRELAIEIDTNRFKLGKEGLRYSELDYGGLQGDIGPVGPPPAVIGTLPSVNSVLVAAQIQLTAEFPRAIRSDGVIDLSTRNLWVFDGTKWFNAGPAGAKGDAGTATAGTTITSDAGSNALVTLGDTSTPSAAVFNFSIPRGKDATVDVGTTITGDPGSDALVENDSTDPGAAVFKFTIPQGDKGDTGTVTVGLTEQVAHTEAASVTNSSTDPSAGVFNFKIPQGKPGAGKDATVTVGITSKGLPGSDPEVSNSSIDPSAAVFNFTIPEGAKGDAATIEAGNVTIGEPGTPASVDNSGSTSAAVFNFTIPKGDKGDDATGADATVDVGETITGEPGSDALVVNVSTNPSSAVFNFTIPRGDKGDEGEPGTPAIAAVDGKSPTLKAGTTTQVPSTEAASVSEAASSTALAVVFDFKIPQGTPGIPGTVSIGNVQTVQYPNVASVSKGSTSTLTNLVLNFSIPRGEKGDSSGSPVGGTTGQVLTKLSGTAGHLDWATITGFVPRIGGIIGAAQLPVGDSMQRPGEVNADYLDLNGNRYSAAKGMLRYHSTNKTFEGYVETGWVDLCKYVGQVYSPNGDKNGAAQIPAGTTAERPSIPVDGMMRYNTGTRVFEVYSDGAWRFLTSGGALTVPSVNGEAFYTIPNTTTTPYYEWLSPFSVPTQVHIVCIGAGGGGRIVSSIGSIQGGGGGLSWVNGFEAQPNTKYKIIVGAPGEPNTGVKGGNSKFTSLDGTLTYIEAEGGGGGGFGGSFGVGGGFNASGGFSGTGGGRGGSGGVAVNASFGGGGGGAGGYSGNGGSGAGSGGSSSSNYGLAGTGGAGSGGSGVGLTANTNPGGGGGGVGAYGGNDALSGTQQSSNQLQGKAGSNGTGGVAGNANGGEFGGGGGGSSNSGTVGGRGGPGAVRIIWGPDRGFPFTKTGLLT